MIIFNFKKKFIEDEEVKKHTKRIIDETKVINSVIQFIEDSGNYKKRSIYNISDYDLKEKLKNFRNQLIQLQANMIFADIIFSSNEKLFSFYEELSKKVTAEIMMQQKNKKVIIDKKDLN